MSGRKRLYPEAFEKCLRWSNSRIGAYLSCPQRYRLQYIKRYKSLIPPMSLTLGDCIHKALNAYYSSETEDPAITYRALWEQWRDKYQEKDWRKFESLDLLFEKYLQQTPIDFFGVIQSEVSYFAPIVDLETGEEYPDEVLWAKFDIVEQKGDDVFLYDFKTMKRAENHNLLYKDPQLLAYSYAYYTLLGVRPKIQHIDLIMQKEPKIQVLPEKPIQFSEIKLQKFSQWLIKITRKIQSEKDFVEYVSFKCGFCPFYELCILEKYDNYISRELAPKK